MAETPPEATSLAFAEQPSSIQMAMRLIFASLVLGLILCGMVGFKGGPTAAGAAIGNLLYTLLVGTCFWHMNMRRGWARYAYAALYGLALPVFIAIANELLALEPNLGVVMFGQIGAQGIACVLLFFGASNRWFNPKLPKPAGPAPFDSRPD